MVKKIYATSEQLDAMMKQLEKANKTREKIANCKKSDNRIIEQFSSLISAVENAATESELKKAQNTLNTELLVHLGKRTGTNAMKRKYLASGIEDFNPFTQANAHTLNDFIQSATLGIAEYISSKNINVYDLLVGAYNDNYANSYQARQKGYAKCNEDENRVKQNTFKHLFIEQMIEDEDGNTTATIIVDVTAEIHSNATIERNEILKAIRPYLTEKQYTVLKYMGEGWTDGMIAKATRRKRQAITRDRHIIRNKALKAIQHDNNLIELLKDFI